MTLTAHTGTGQAVLLPAELLASLGSGFLVVCVLRRSRIGPAQENPAHASRGAEDRALGPVSVHVRLHLCQPTWLLSEIKLGRAEHRCHAHASIPCRVYCYKGYSVFSVSNTRAPTARGFATSLCPSARLIIQLVNGCIYYFFCRPSPSQLSY